MKRFVNEEQRDALPSKVSGVRLGGASEASGELDFSRQTAERMTNKYIGTLLKGKWRVERLLGFGGMAYVFAARHRNGRRVALKCMRPELVLQATLFERFVREGYVANTIEHPGAVAILDDDVMDDGTPFLVMELLSGMSLRERVDRGPLNVHEALSMTGQVLDVLVAAHKKGVVHRDLKPDNIFLTDEGDVKVLDFGIARLRDRLRPKYETEAGYAMGTVGFMAPEQARGLLSEVDAQSDVWSIGATLFTLLTGTVMHDAESTNEALLLAMTRAAPPMGSAAPWLPRSVQDLLDRALAFDKAERFSSAQAMLSALEAARAEVRTLRVLPAPPRRPPPSSTQPGEPKVPAVEPGSAAVVAREPARRGAVSPKRRGGPSRSTYAALAAAATLLLGGVAWFSLGNTQQAPAPEPAPTTNVATALEAAPRAAVSTSKALPSEPSPPMPSSCASVALTGPSRVAPTKKAKPSGPTPSQSNAPETRDPLGVRH